MKSIIKAMMICMAAVSIAQAQTADSADQGESSQDNNPVNSGSVESERARLGMQRIQTESEIRAREEQARLEEAQRKARQEQWRLEQVERERAQAAAMQSQAASTAIKDPQPASVPSPEPQPAAAPTSKDMSQTLEQLRTLGELKDAGYVTEEEFQKIKRRILDSRM